MRLLVSAFCIHVKLAVYIHKCQRQTERGQALKIRCKMTLLLTPRSAYNSSSKVIVLLHTGHDGERSNHS